MPRTSDEILSEIAVVDATLAVLNSAFTSSGISNREAEVTAYGNTITQSIQHLSGLLNELASVDPEAASGAFAAHIKDVQAYIAGAVRIMEPDGTQNYTDEQIADAVQARLDRTRSTDSSADRVYGTDDPAYDRDDGDDDTYGL